MTTFSPLILVSAQLLNTLRFLRNEFAAKYRQTFNQITGLNSGISSESSPMKSVSQLVLTVERPFGKSPSITRRYDDGR